jgi:hypothetical protein
MRTNTEPDRPRRQHYNFVHRYLRDRALDHPHHLVETLRGENGTSYLESLWVSQGSAEKAEEDEFIGPEGLECFSVDPGSEIYGAIVKFPEPQRAAEAYFAAIILRSRTNKDLPARFITLERGISGEGNVKTVVGGWDVLGIHYNYGPGPTPEMDEFVKVLRKQFPKTIRR